MINNQVKRRISYIQQGITNNQGKGENHGNEKTYAIVNGQPVGDFHLRCRNGG